MQWQVAIPYRRFGTNYRHIVKGKEVRMGPIGGTETSVLYYHSTLRNTWQESRSHVLSGESMTSRTKLSSKHNSKVV